jgi:hypothetical protein
MLTIFFKLYLVIEKTDNYRFLDKVEVSGTPE